MKILLSEDSMNSNVNMRNFPIRKPAFPPGRKRCWRPAPICEEENGVFTLAPLPEEVRKDYESAYQDLGHAVFSFGFLSGRWRAICVNTIRTANPWTPVSARLQTIWRF